MNKLELLIVQSLQAGILSLLRTLIPTGSFDLGTISFRDAGFMNSKYMEF